MVCIRWTENFRRKMSTFARKYPDPSHTVPTLTSAPDASRCHPWRCATCLLAPRRGAATANHRFAVLYNSNTTPTRKKRNTTTTITTPTKATAARGSSLLRNAAAGNSPRSTTPQFSCHADPANSRHVKRFNLVESSLVSGGANHMISMIGPAQPSLRALCIHASPLRMRSRLVGGGGGSRLGWSAAFELLHRSQSSRDRLSRIPQCSRARDEHALSGPSSYKYQVKRMDRHAWDTSVVASAGFRIHFPNLAAVRLSSRGHSDGWRPASRRRNATTSPVQRERDKNSNASRANKTLAYSWRGT